MSETSTAALSWLWNNDPDLTTIDGTPEGAALLIATTAAPVRWGPAGDKWNDLIRAARAIEVDPYYLDQVWPDARSRIDSERGSYALLGERLTAARKIVGTAQFERAVSA